MADVEWTKVEGMVIAAGLDPMKLAQELKDRSVVASLEWYESSPELVALTLGATGDKVATIGARGRVLKAGPSLEALVEDLAKALKAEVMFGAVSADGAPDGDIEAAFADDDSHERTATRIVEIGQTPASAVPLMAAFEGVDIAELELPEDKRLLASVIPASRNGWYFGDAPVVTLSMDGEEFQASFVAEDDPESVVTYNWGMKDLVVAGGRGWDGDVPEVVSELVGAMTYVQAIHDAVPGIDADAAFKATQLRGYEAVQTFVASLGLPSDVADFLLGAKGIEQIAGATVHHARGISNAIGRSVDILIDERQEGSPFWNGYTDIIADRRWLIPAVTAVEATIGLGLLFLGRKRDGSRSGVGRAGTVVGSLMIVDSIAQNALAKYMGRKSLRGSSAEDSYDRLDEPQY